MSAPKQFIRSVDFLSTEDSTSTSNGSVNIFGGMSVSKTSYLTNTVITGNTTLANIYITGNLINSAGSSLTSSQFTTINSNSVYFGTSGSAFVGIGTTTPSFQLDISGGSRITGGLTTGTLAVVSGASIPNLLSTTITTGTLNTTNISGSNSTMTNVLSSNVSTTNLITSIFTATTSTIGTLFTTGGNVGVGTMSPSNLLNVNGIAAIGTLIGNVSTQTTNDTIYIGTGGSANFFIDRPTNSSGGGTIFFYNTQKPAANSNILQVYNNSTDRNLLLAVQSKGATGTDQVQSNTYFNANFNSNTVGTLYTTGGNVGINNVAPAFSLDVSGSARITTNLTVGGIIYTDGNQSIQIAPTTNGAEASVGFYQNTAYSGIGWVLGHNTGSGSGNFSLYNTGIGTNCFVVTTSGNSVFGNGFTTVGGGTFNSLTAYPKLTVNSNTGGWPAITGTVGSSIGLRVRGQDDACLDMGVFTGNGSWLQSTNFNGYSFSYPLMLNPNGGNVGIGTTVATYALDIKRNGTAQINLQNYGSNASQMLIWSYNDSKNYIQTSGDLVFADIQQSTQRALSLTTGGNVNIGSSNTFSPMSKLTIVGGGGNFGTTQASIAFSFAPNPGYYHFITSRHNAVVTSNLNALDFWMNNSASQTGSTAPNFGNVNAMTVTATGVGIFNSIPSYTLDVNGSFRLFSNVNGIPNNHLIQNTNSGSAAYAILQLANDSASATSFFLNSSTRSSDGGVRAATIRNDGGPLRLQSSPSGNTGIYISTSGNIGINNGITTPLYMLDIIGSTKITNTSSTSMGTLIVSGPNSSAPATATSGQLMSMYGTGSPGAICNIDLSTYLAGSGSNNLPSVRFSMLDLGSANSTFSILTRNSGSTGTMGSRLFIDGSGNIGINTTIPTYNLDVNGSVNASGQLYLNNGTRNTIFWASGVGIDFPTAASDMGSGCKLRLWNNYGIGIESGSIWYSSGGGDHKFYNATVATMLLSGSNLTVVGDITAFGTISDQRLKTNITSIDANVALNIINQLNPVTFNWKNDIFNKEYQGKSDAGFIAQEVEPLIPLATSEYVDINSGDVYKNLRHERFNPYIVSSVQALSAQITQLETQMTEKDIIIANLIQRLEALESLH